MMKLKIKGIFVKTLLIILAASFILFGMANFFSGVGNTNIVKIDSEKVSLNRFIRFLNEKRNQYYESELTDSDLDLLNSKKFIEMALVDFIEENLLYIEINKLKIKQPKESVLDDVYNERIFKDANNNFDIDMFKTNIAKSGLTEDAYINYLSIFNSRNNLLELLTLPNLSNKFILESLSKFNNRYVIADVIKINPNNLKFKIKKPSNSEIEEYYNSHRSEFIVPEQRVISSIEIDLSKYKGEDAKVKLSELEDLVLSSKNIDEISNVFAVTKNTITYSKGDVIPNDLNIELLQYSQGTFSDLIYKDNNVYQVYFVEEVIPSKMLTLAEATPKIEDILSKKLKIENETAVLNDMITKNHNPQKIASATNAKLISDETIYKNNLFYADNFITELYNLRIPKSFTKPVFDAENNLYLIGYLKEVKKIQTNSSRFVPLQTLTTKFNRSYASSILNLFQNYLFKTNKIIINNKLLESLE